MRRLAKMMMVGLMALTVSGITTDAMAKKAPDCEKGGVKYGVVEGNFREEWYSYQERAESYLAGECFEPALSDFESAIKLRTAIDRAAKTPGCDTRRARSYGMHFEDWFGHRGRGISLYQLGNIDQAIKELEFSLKCTESSQAQYFLDKARAKKLKTSGADTSNPVLKSVRLVRTEPRIDFIKEGSPSPAPGYDKYLSFPYYFTVDEIETILEGLSKKQRKQLDLSPGWGHQVISWKSADEIPSLTVSQGSFYAVVEAEDDQGVQFVEASGTKSPYIFAQKKRADIFPLKIEAEASGAEEETDIENMETRDLFFIPIEEARGGANLNFSVTDLLGKKGEKSLALVIDNVGPQISIEDVKRTPDGKAKIQGIWDDDSGISSFKIGGVVPGKAGGNGFEVTAPVENERVRFEIVDKAGNMTSGVINLGQRPKGTKALPPFRWTKAIRKLYRLAALDVFDAPVLASPPRPADLHPWTNEPRPWPDVVPVMEDPIELAVDVEMYWNEVQNTLGMTPQPPDIILKAMYNKVYTNQIYLEGRAVGKGAMLTSVTVNRRNVLKSPRSNAFFNKLVYLRPGRNSIQIQAVDEKGQVAKQTLNITRIVPKVRTVAERLAVSMLPFYQNPSFKEIGDVAYDNLATNLIRQRRFRYVDRSKVNAAIREARLSGTGLVNAGTAVRAGRMTNSEAIIIGVVRETPTSIEVKAQVVDVETSRIMVTRDAFHQDKSLGNLQFITRGLATKLKNAFPIVQGNIQKSQGNSVVITLGRRNRIKPGMKVVFFKVIPRTDAAGNPIGVDTQKIGYGSVMSTSSSASTVQVTKTQGAAPKAQDLVITK
jgi:hypothetical protein